MATKRTKTPKRDLAANPYTKEEKIAMALDTYRSGRHGDNPGLITEPTYQFTVGEQVSLGALNDCIVDSVLDGGKVLVIDYHDIGKHYGQPYDHGRKYRVVPWFDVEPTVTIKDTHFAHTRRHHSYSQSTLDSMIFRRRHRGFWDDVDYQRGYVWTAKDKENLLTSIFDDRDIGKFVFVEHQWPENRLEVLDGKQRLNAICDFVEGRYPYKGFFWNELSWFDKRMFQSRMVQYMDLQAQNLTKLERLDVFLSLNRGGVPQTEEHIAKVVAMYEEELKKENGQSK